MFLAGCHRACLSGLFLHITVAWTSLFAASRDLQPGISGRAFSGQCHQRTLITAGEGGVQDGDIGSIARKQVSYHALLVCRRTSARRA